MSQSTIFNESGSIAGIPGTFANVRVDVADDGTLTQTPLATHPAFVPAPETPLEVALLTKEVQNTSKAKGVQ